MRNKTYSLILLSLLLLCNIVKAQVGIGTLTPSAQLTLETGTTNIAPLGLGNLSVAPSVNLVGGQISVIDNELYFYNDTLAKWLSVATMPLTFARNGNISNQNLFFGGRVSNANSGAIMPFNGTIVHISAKGANNSGTGNKRFNIRIRNNGTLISSFNLDLDNDDFFNKTDYNFDFSVGDNIVVRKRTNTSSVNNPVVIVWVKWRK